MRANESKSYLSYLNKLLDQDNNTSLLADAELLSVIRFLVKVTLKICH